MDAEIKLYRLSIGNHGSCKPIPLGSDGEVLEPLSGSEIIQLVVRFKAAYADAKVMSLTVSPDNGRQVPIWRYPVRADDSIEDEKKAACKTRIMKSFAHLGCGENMVVYATSVVLRVAEDAELIGELMPDTRCGLRFIELEEDGEVRMLNVWHVGLVKENGEFYLRKEKLRTVAAPEEISERSVLAHIRDLPHLFLD